MGPRMVSLPSEMPTVARNSFGDISKRRSLLTWEATRACTVPQMRSEKKKVKEKWKKEGKRGKYSQTRTKQALHNSEQQMAIIVLTVTHNGITLHVRGKKASPLSSPHLKRKKGCIGDSFHTHQLRISQALTLLPCLRAGNVRGT